MTAAAPLRRIEDRLIDMATGITYNTPATAGEAATLAHELRILAAQVACQAEIVEKGLQGDAM